MINTRISNNKSKKRLLGVLFSALLLSPSIPFGLAKIKHEAPQAFLSPLAENQTFSNPDTAVKIYNLDYYLSLSGSLLQKATRLANDDSFQSEEEKLLIVDALNKSLSAVNQAIEYYPQRPEGFLARAQIWQKVKHLYPEAENAAKTDLNIANALMAQNKSNTGQDVDWQKNLDIAKNSSPIDTLPTKKAGLPKKLTIAEPNQDSRFPPVGRAGMNQDSRSQIDTNTLSGKGMIKAGEKETIIDTPELGASDKVYVVAGNNPENMVLSVFSRENGAWFKAGVDSPVNTDLEFSWWIIPGEQSQEQPNSQSITNYKTVS